MTAPIDLRADAIELRRGGRSILRGIDVVVPPGDVVALVGPSGSGKTSLLTVLASAETADSGIVRYNGQAVTPADRTAWAGRVQLVHQSFGLLSLLTAAENVELALQGLDRRRRPARGRLREASQEALDMVGLSARADNLVEELSGGEQQRVALARALVTSPDLVLADEPTAQLDPANRERVTELLFGLARAGATVVIATHDDDLSGRCAAVITLRDGAVVQPDHAVRTDHGAVAAEETADPS